MNKRGMKRQIVGTVVSNGMNKTVIIVTDRLVKHQIYKKYVKKRTKFAAHDESNRCNVGDKVLISESRPISKTKRWRVSDIVKKAVSL